MKSYHNILIDQLAATGYPKHDNGLCEGPAGLGVIDILSESTAERNKMVEFLSNIPPDKLEHEIETAHSLWKSIVAGIKSKFQDQQLVEEEIKRTYDILGAELKSLLTAHAYFNTLEIIFSWDNYSYLYWGRGESRAQDLMMALDRVMPESLSKQGGITKVYDFLGCYFKEDLDTLFTSLRASLKKSNCQFPVAIHLMSCNHAITIGYNPKDEDWILIDANSGPSQHIPDELIGETIHDCFSTNPYAIFHTDMYVLHQYKDTARTMINQWVSEEGFRSSASISASQVNVTDNYGGTLLQVAVTHDNKFVTKFLLEHGANPLIKHQNGLIPIFTATLHGNHDIVEQLLNHGADVKQLRFDQSSALHTAAANGDINILTLLLAKGADCNLKNDKGITPLHFAVRYGDLECAQALIAHGADINATTEYGLSPVYTAVLYSSIVILNNLLEAGADPNIPRNDGVDALIIAIISGQLDMVETLLKHGVNPNSIRLPTKSLPLFEAAIINDGEEIIKCLVRYGADVNAIIHSMTALDLAIDSGHVSNVKTLLSLGADINLSPYHDMSPAYIAANDNLLEILLELIAHGADLNKPADTGETPLTRSITNKNIEITKALLANHVDVNYADKIGWTALTLAASLGDVDVIKLLLNHGANINQATNDNTTALMCAAWQGNTEAVKLLLDSGADPVLRDNKGKSALDMAVDTVHPACADILRDHSAKLSQTGMFKPEKNAEHMSSSTLINTPVLR